MTTPKFLRCYAMTLKWEGEGCHQAAGEDWRTCWGIAERYHPELFHDGPPTQEAAQRYTFEHWWEGMGCESLPFALAAQVFDHGFNAGAARALDLLARAGHYHDEFFLGRLAFYTAPERRNRNLNLAGWVNRCVDVYRVALADARFVNTLVLNNVGFGRRVAWLFGRSIDRSGWVWLVRPEAIGTGLKLDVRPVDS